MANSGEEEIGISESELESENPSDESEMSYVSEEISEDTESDFGDELTVKAKRSKSKRKPSVAGGSTASKKKKRKARRRDNELDVEEMKDLTSWIFSNELALKVEDFIRGKLLQCPQLAVAEERKAVAKHFLSEEQKPNFSILIVGFCRKFSTLATEHYSLNSQDRKAAFSFAWLKALTNFHPSKKTQERAIVERLLRGKNYDDEVVLAVPSVIHELVYFEIHSLIQERKSGPSAPEKGNHTSLAEEMDHILYRYGGFALNKMIKLRREKLQQKDGRLKASNQWMLALEKELTILHDCVMKEKSNIPSHLTHLDEENLTFPRKEMLPFIRKVDEQVREFCTDENLRRYPTKFIKMCQSSVKENEVLEVDFRSLVASFSSCKEVTGSQIVDAIYKDFVSKLANVSLNEYKCTKEERDLKDEGKVVNADEMLHPNLKAFAIASKRN